MAVYVPVRPRWNPRGQVVNYVFNGQLCARSWPRGYRDANTAAQRRQRGKMAQVGEALPYVKGLLAAGYPPVAKRNGRRVGGYQRAVAAALREWFVEGPGGPTLDLARLRLTDGVRALPAGLAVARAGERLRVAGLGAARWQGVRLLLAAREPGANAWASTVLPLAPGAEGVTVRLPAAWRAKAVEVWVALAGSGAAVRTQTLYRRLSPRSASPGGAVESARAPLPPARKGRPRRAERATTAAPPGGCTACLFGARGRYCMERRE